jgi:N-acetylglucosamine-6-phosphate deacetylase
MTAATPLLVSGNLVLPDRVLSPGTVTLDQGRIADIQAHSRRSLAERYILPGFIDVHVHGVNGVDVLNGFGSVRAVSRQLVRFGVTAFCPTTVACAPQPLGEVLAETIELRQAPAAGGARVLPAHLESNFLNQRYRGAQPERCLRDFGSAAADRDSRTEADSFTSADILREVDHALAGIAIVTVAPEITGGLDLVERFAARGLHVSLGHSGATLEQANEAIEAGALQATHLFNRMPPLDHRSPGLAGAILQSPRVVAELICDGHHVHPAMLRLALAAKGASGVMAISDGTAAAGLRPGTQSVLGGQTIETRESAAFLLDGTLAGSTATMDRVLRVLVEQAGVSLIDAANMCATTPARALGLANRGVLEIGAAADLVVLDRNLSVIETYVDGELVFADATRSCQ